MYFFYLTSPVSSSASASYFVKIKVFGIAVSSECLDGPVQCFLQIKPHPLSDLEVLGHGVRKFFIFIMLL